MTTQQACDYANDYASEQLLPCEWEAFISSPPEIPDGPESEIDLAVDQWRSSLTLCKYADPTEGAKEGLTLQEAIEIASEDPSLIYVK